MTKHTPGPWFDSEGDKEGERFISTANRVHVAFTGRQLSAQQNRANARLIAAAPRLLEIVERLSSMCPSGEGLGGHAPISAFLELGRQARAAIAEATGETNTDSSEEPERWDGQS